MTLTSPPVRAEERAEPIGPAPGTRSGRKSPISGKVFIVAGVALAIGYLALVPLGYLIWGTFFDANNNLDFSGFQRAYGNGRMGELWGNSLAFAGGSAILSLTVGTDAGLPQRPYGGAVQGAVLRRLDRAADRARHPLHGLVDLPRPARRSGCSTA